MANLSIKQCDTLYFSDTKILGKILNEVTPRWLVLKLMVSTDIFFGILETV